MMSLISLWLDVRMNYLLDYYNEIQNGNIVVGKELFTVIESLIADMNNPR